MGYIRIKTIIRKGGDPRTFAGALAKNNMSRLPGCGTTITPYREGDGRYRTGLDENAVYINSLSSEEQVIERERVKILREKLEKQTGLDLSPNSDFYKKIYDNENGAIATATPYKISDREIVLNEDFPEHMIAAAWLQVHPVIARSLEDTKYNANAIAYISNPTAETEAEYTEKMKYTKAITALAAMNPAQLRRMARLLELPVNEDSTPAESFMLLDKLLNRGTVEFGSYKGKKSVNVFNDLTGLSETTLSIKELIKKAIAQSIYRKNKAGVIMQGENVVADSEEDLIATLAASVEERTSLEKRVKSKTKLTA